MKGGAVFSPCRCWRYTLTRSWNTNAEPMVVIGLNPSTADEKDDDPTIIRCIDFAMRWKFGGLMMLNLFAFRSTDPKGLDNALDPIGPENDRWLQEATLGRSLVLCAWGVHGAKHGREFAVRMMLEDRPTFTLGLTKDGHPRHPLYVSARTQPVPYELPEIP